MSEHEMAFIATNDIASVTRGRAMRLADMGPTSSCGWVPANLGIGPFGKIVDGVPFGSVGDLRLRPDMNSLTRTEGILGRPALTTFLADIIHNDGTPWDCCPRTFLRDAIRDLSRETDVVLSTSFEHEFTMVTDSDPEPPFSAQALRRAEPWGTELVRVLHDAGFEPETWLPEYGEHQWEITMSPSDPLTAADRAVMLRDIVRDVTHAHGGHASFAPLLHPDGSGNGVHVHLSLHNSAGDPLTYDPARPGRLSSIAGSFAAGILRHAPAIVALSACSDISYLRLAPHRWSAAESFLGEHNREALLRICPTNESNGKDPASQLNLEYRAADVSGNPWIIMGALIRAGLEGIRENLPAPEVVTVEASALSEEERNRAGIVSLPTSLSEALAALEADRTVSSWFSPNFMATFQAIKRDELRVLSDLTDLEKCERYTHVY